MLSKVYLLFTFSFIIAALQPVYALQDANISSESDSTRVLRWLTEAESDLEQGNLSEARRKTRRADSLSDELQFQKGKALSSLRYADILINEQRQDSAIVVLNEAIKKYPDSNLRVNFNNLLAVAYSYKGEDAKAIETYEEGLKYVSRLDSAKIDRTNAGIRQNMANAYLDLGQTTRAFEYYLDAVRFAEMTRDTTFWATTLNNIGNAYNSEENYERAAFYLEKAMTLSEQKNLIPELYRTTLNLANTRNGQERLKEALDLYNEALELNNQIRPDSPPVIVLYNLGRLNGKLGNYEQAEAQFRESLAYSQQLGIIQGEYYNNFGLGNLYREMERYEEAIQYFENAKDIAERLGATPFMQDIREKLYETNREANRFEEALLYLELYKELSDSLTSIEKEQALAELENQLELDRQNEVNRLLQDKQAQQERQLQVQYIFIVVGSLVIALIVVLLFMMRKSAREREEINTVLEAQKEELIEASKAKDKLFAIIAHDLRTPMSSMQGILHLLKGNVISNEELTQLIPELEMSIQKNVHVMEDLLAWAKDQLSGVKMEISAINIHNVVDEIVSSHTFIANKKGVEVHHHISEDEHVLADQNALQLVVRNVVSNSIKFTGKGDEIEIKAEPDSQNVKIIIRDTGIGITKEAAGKVFSKESWTREGTNKEKGTGFGLSLSKEFVERMNGKIWFESTEGEGSTFYIELPKASSN
ncbi:MAG: tetratricopeptide repeat protein [Gracilimonas sp.]|uniref:tetratricopeptide repeat protein n=1 Tax=Gracilimonas TaxID=649462 RepID=UPI001B1676CA|nr:tetratricopeptide repeat protein [Gracilimonas sp.]MBO6585684.1 tetratricopeptide repeat protein [Gracilimonas sp.]MBO6616681.1 tetratricopeptide repeat protein [Gracilimonas sp.]